jgi:methylenetetrahydrofolate--tRNA-(uracil-5-)-methyltransferase
MLGALYRDLREADPAHFQPMNANFGLLEPLDPPVKDRTQKRARLAERAVAEFETFAVSIGMGVAA